MLRGTSGKESAYQCRRFGFDSWAGEMPWKRKWLLTPVFLPGKPHGQRSLAGYSSWGHKESDMLATKQPSCKSFLFLYSSKMR